MAITTNAVLFTKHPQYVEETTEGTTPTASPSFASCGAVKSLSLKIDGSFVDVAQIASEDLIAIVQGMQTYESQITFTIVNSTFIKYGINAANFATPTSTISKSLTILFGFYLNGTENFVLMKGSRCKNITMKADIGKEIEFTMDFVHMTITTPNATHGLTTPSFATLPSGAVFDWTSGGVTPVSYNGSAIDARSFSLNINRNSTPTHILGNLNPHSTQPHARKIAGDFSVLSTVTTLEADFKAPAAAGVTVLFVLKSATSTITITGAKIVSYTRDDDISSDEATVEQCGFRALSVSVS